MIKILFVCLGNICRSAAAEAVMKSIVEEYGVSDRFYIDSAGILSVHQGEQADPRMRSIASARGYQITSISRPVTYDDFDKFDWLIGMDDSNVDALMDKANQLPSFLGDFEGVCITDNPYVCGLIRKKAPRLFEVEYFTVTVENGKIVDITG